ncbi:hypothetical protein [Prochlorothrix hollandica]|uniref:slr1601 family putative cell division protein n=1 Tax=Prochlorothrix hollandica TaxID=1223 RepID=UPI003340ABC6
MYATRPDSIDPPLQSTPRPRSGSRHPSPKTLAQREARRRAQLNAQLTEVCVKLSLNTLLALAFVSALWHLVPYHHQQRLMLQEAQKTLTESEERVADLQLSFSQLFDPKQTNAAMQSQSYRVDPSQRQVIWLEPKH